MNFTDYIENLKSLALLEYKNELNDIRSQATQQGALGGSRMYVMLQAAISKQVGAFGSQLIDFMIKNDPLHSPITTKDFELAEVAVAEFLALLKVEYQGHAVSGKAFGNSIVEIDQEYLDLEKNKAIQELRLAKATFKSKRSFIKWAIGDTQRRIFTSISSIILIGVGAFLEEKFALLKKLIASILQ